MGRVNRVQATAQLVPGKDDDLIRWLGRQSNHNEAVKAALRRGVNVPVASAPVAVGVPTDLEQEFRQKLAQVDQLIAQLQRAVESGAVVAAPQVSEADRLADEVKTDRLSRLKRANW